MTMGSGGAPVGSGGMLASGGSPHGDGGSGNSGGMAGNSGASQAFVPKTVSFTELTDADQGVNVVAATLTQGPLGLEFYGSLRNDGETAACSGAIGIELFDAADQTLGAFNGGLFGAQIYRINGLDQAVGCIDPHQVGMAGIVNIDESLTLDQVASVVYRFTYFNAEFFEDGLTALDSFTVTDLELVEEGANQVVFSGALANSLDALVKDPSVTIFQVNDVGRPLGMVSVSRTEDLTPGTTWNFRTSSIDGAVESQFAFPSGTIEFY
jgi:hypothetical protein